MTPASNKEPGYDGRDDQPSDDPYGDWQTAHSRGALGEDLTGVPLVGNSAAIGLSHGDVWRDRCIAHLRRDSTSQASRHSKGSWTLMEATRTWPSRSMTDPRRVCFLHLNYASAEACAFHPLTKIFSLHFDHDTHLLKPRPHSFADLIPKCHPAHSPAGLP